MDVGQLLPKRKGWGSNGSDKTWRKPHKRGCRRGTHSFKDRLERADAGSWQIADRFAASSTDHAAVFDFRVRFAVELWLILELVRILRQAPTR